MLRSRIDKHGKRATRKDSPSGLCQIPGLMTTTAFVTGGTGFIGQQLVRALREQGHEVLALVRPASFHGSAAERLRALEAKLVPGDLGNPCSFRDALRGVDRVFHLAGRLFAPGIAAEAYEQLHVEGTHNLLTACQQASHIESIVHCSTTGVVGPTGSTPAAEDARPRPSNDYERTKADGEQLALRMARQHNLPLIVARPALVYGPGDLHLLGWFRAIQRGYYRVIGRGDSLLHPIYIGDVVRGMLKCTQVPAALGRVYHLVGEAPVPIRDLAGAIAQALGKELSRWHLPAAPTWGGAALVEALPGVTLSRLPLTRSRINFMTQSRAYSGDRARHELGFVPQIDLQTGLQHTVAWYRQEGLL